MTQVAIQSGLLYPEVNAVGGIQLTLAVMDAAGEKHAHIGRLYIAGKPSGAKTLSTGTIQFVTGTCTFANGSTKLSIGIQDVATGAGPIAQPDGNFDVSVELTGGAGITSNTWNTATMNSGSKSMSHGDLIAVVWDMTAYGGVDIVRIGVITNYLYAAQDGSNAVTNSYIAGAWQTTNTLGAGRGPNVIITFDDGTLGWIEFTTPVKSYGPESFKDSTAAGDERGLIFQVPWDCKVDALWFRGYASNANADFTMKLYSDPTGTPTLLASCDQLAETGGPSGTIGMNSLLTKVSGVITEISLSKDTDYIVTVRATGTGDVALGSHLYNDTSHRAVLNNGLTLKKATRVDDTGAFTPESPAVKQYVMGVRICSLDDGTGSGSGGGLIRHPGMNGGLNG